jgi:N-acetylmuramoyl-L-alanine amidase
VPTPILRIIVNKGHGASNASPGVFDPGASSPFGQEHAIVSSLADALVDRYWFNDKTEVSVVPTPECSDACLTRHRKVYNDAGKLVPSTHLSETIRWVNTHCHPFDLLLSLHMNAGPEGANGSEVLYASPHMREMAALAARVYSQAVGLRNRGAKTDIEAKGSRVGILSRTKPRALLVECGFVTNEHDVRRVKEGALEALVALIEAVRQV